MDPINLTITLTKYKTYIGVEDSSGAEYSTQEYTPQEAFNQYMEDYLPTFLDPEPFIYDSVNGPVEIVNFNKDGAMIYFLDINGYVVFSIGKDDVNKDYTLEQFADVFGMEVSNETEWTIRTARWFWPRV